MDELVSVMVPRRHLARVYGLIATLDGGEDASEQKAPQTSGSGPALDGANDKGWSRDRIRKLVRASSPAQRAVMRALARRPDEWLTMKELANAIRPGSSWRTIGGTLGSLGNRVGTPPWENRYDYKVRGRVCRMSGEIARQVLESTAAGED